MTLTSLRLFRAGFLSLLMVSSALLSAVPRASSQSPASTASNDVRPELQPLSFFIGHWDCSGEFTASKKQISSRITISPDLDGSWLAFRWDDNAPNVFHALELWGFDKSAHHFTNFIHDNFGGVRLFTSPGWDADTFIWTGDALANPPTANQRFVIERKPPSKFVITWQVRKPQSDWVTGDSLTCREE
jgi:hypothetical protein